MPETEFDYVFAVNSVNVTVFPEDESAQLELFTTLGENVAIVLSGSGLIGVRDQIDKALNALPEIATWGSGVVRH